MTSSNPRLIPGQSVPGDLVTWEAPQVQRPAEQQTQDAEAQLQALHEQARQEGFAAGRAEGLANAQADITARTSALAAVLDAFTRPMADLDRQVEEELLELVRAVSQQLVRRELRTDPGEVVGVIRACLDALPAANGEVVVKLHPEDATLVRELLQPADGDTPWRIQADPVLARGGCLVSADCSQVDGRLETRLGRVIAGLFEDQRDALAPEDG